jgi:hypothetical protein
MVIIIHAFIFDIIDISDNIICIILLRLGTYYFEIAIAVRTASV